MGFVLLYLFIGTVIAEVIIFIYAVGFANPEEQEQAKRISQKAIRNVKVPAVPFLTTPAYESAAATGAYSIMPVRVVGAFMVIWYIIIPTIWTMYSLFTTSPHIQEIWGLMMKAAIGG